MLPARSRPLAAGQAVADHAPASLAVGYKRTRGNAGQGHATTSERIYSDAEAEFLRAVEAFKRKHRRPFPTHTELFGVLLSLGYAKQCDSH